MYLSVIKLANGRKKLKSMQSFRKPENGKSSTAIIRDLGFPMNWRRSMRILSDGVRNWQPSSQHRVRRDPYAMR